MNECKPLPHVRLEGAAAEVLRDAVVEQEAPAARLEPQRHLAVEARYCLVAHPALEIEDGEETGSGVSGNDKCVGGGDGEWGKADCARPCGTGR